MSREIISSTDDQERQELLSALRESEVLRELAELLTSSLDLKSILQALTRRTTGVCGIERCSVWLKRDDQQAFHPSAYHLSSKRIDAKHIRAADHLWYHGHVLFDDAELLQCLEKQDIVLVDDLRARPGSRSIAEKFLVRSVMLVALKREGRLLGMMSLDDPDTIRTFSPGQQQLARAIGQQAAVAIDNAHLYEQAQIERKRAERLIQRAQAINQVAVAVNAGEALTKVMDMALHHLVRALGSDGGAIALLEGGSLHLFSHTKHRQQLEDTDIELDTLPTCCQAATTGNPIFVNAQLLNDTERQWFQALGLGNCIIVPLMGGKAQSDAANRQAAGGQCSGFAFVDFHDPAYTPTKGQIAFAQDIAAQCALAVEKDHLLADLHKTAALANERANTLDAVFQALSEGITVLDENGDVLVRNRAASHFLGIPVNSKDRLGAFLQRYATFNLLGQPLPEEDFPLSRALRGERIRGERFSTFRSDGAERVIEVNVTDILDEFQNHAGFVSAFRDVTEQTRVERRIRSALEAILEITEAISGLTDIEEILQSVLELTLSTMNCERGLVQMYEDGVFKRLLSSGFADEQEEERWLADQRHWLMPEPEQYQGFRAQILEGHATAINAGQYPNQPNPYQQTMMLAIPITYQGQVLGLMTIDRSIHGDTNVFAAPGERAFPDEFTIWDLAIAEGIAQLSGLAVRQGKTQQEVLRARANEAAMRAANALKDEFLAIAAHEFRNPLSIILMNSQTVLRILRKKADKEVLERVSEYLKKIDGQTRLLNNIVHTFLDASYLHGGQLNLQTEPLDLAKLVKQVVTDQATTTEKHTLTCTIAASERPYLVMGDSARLQEIVANLVQNAIKYSPTGGAITISMRQLPGDEQTRRLIEVCINDTGIGIPADALPHIFERFYRARNSLDSETRGIGLGLYIVAELIRLHGGSIRAESSGVPGEGSRFIFTLPTTESEPVERE